MTIALLYCYQVMLVSMDAHYVCDWETLSKGHVEEGDSPSDAAR